MSLYFKYLDIMLMLKTSFSKHVLMLSVIVNLIFGYEMRSFRKCASRQLN